MAGRFNFHLFKYKGVGTKSDSFYNNYFNSAKYLIVLTI